MQGAKHTPKYTHFAIDTKTLHMPGCTKKEAKKKHGIVLTIVCISCEKDQYIP